jgi:hypothetical protein
VPAGALTALGALIAIRREFIHGLSALDAQEQILAYALVFGYAYQLLTGLIDRQAMGLLSSVPSKDAQQGRPQLSVRDPGQPGGHDVTPACCSRERGRGPVSSGSAGAGCASPSPTSPSSSPLCRSRLASIFAAGSGRHEAAQERNGPRRLGGGRGNRARESRPSVRTFRHGGRSCTGLPVVPAVGSVPTAPGRTTRIKRASRSLM